MKFVLHWKGSLGDQIVEGPDIATAMNNAGIGRGALGALDYWEKEKDETKEEVPHDPA